MHVPTEVFDIFQRRTVFFVAETQFFNGLDFSPNSRSGSVLLQHIDVLKHDSDDLFDLFHSLFRQVDVDAEQSVGRVVFKATFVVSTSQIQRPHS